MVSVALVIIAVIFFFIILYLISVFNNFVSLKNNIRKAWANIDVLLKQRYDELPNLIETVKGYMKHEKKTLEELTKMRTELFTATTKEQKAKLNEQIGGSIKSLFAVAENYPKLQANQNFLKLQERITALENEIADRREFYNDSVNIYNTKLESFPENLVAKMFKYTREEPFSVTIEEKQNVNPNI